MSIIIPHEKKSRAAQSTSRPNVTCLYNILFYFLPKYDIITSNNNNLAASTPSHDRTGGGCLPESR